MCCCNATNNDGDLNLGNVGGEPAVRTPCKKALLIMSIALGIIAVLALAAILALAFAYAMPVAIAAAIGTAVLAMGGTVKVAAALGIILAVSTIAATIFGCCSKPTAEEPIPVDNMLLNPNV
jgi:hypothetical protein